MSEAIQHTSTLTWIKDQFKDERPLTLREEAVLFALAQKGNSTARTIILKSNMKFVIQVAQQFYNSTLSTEELINEGAMGLLRAVDSFDYTRGVRFITYAVWWIKAFIARAISEKGSLIRLPLNQQTKLHKAIRNSKKKSDLSEEILHLNSFTRAPLSLSTPLNENNTLHYEDILEDTCLESPEQEISNELRTKFTNKLLSKIPSRERQILEQMHGLKGVTCKSVREISRTLGLSRERVRQLRDQAISRLRNLNCDKHLTPTLQELTCNA